MTPAPDAPRSAQTQVIPALLRGARLEVLPARGIIDALREHSPASRTVTITASESLGLDATFATAAALRADGRTVIPHLAARMVNGRAHLSEIVQRLAGDGIDALFVPGGDATPGRGAYTSSVELLTDLAELDHPFRTIGVAAYPEPHPTIPADALAAALAAKQPLATELVSNLCFDPDAVSAWVHRLRGSGGAPGSGTRPGANGAGDTGGTGRTDAVSVSLPLQLGVPGRVDAARLARVGARIGVGQSLRFVKGKMGTVARLLTPGGFDSQRLLTRMGPVLTDPAARIAGLHVYTFNEIARTEEWLRAGAE